MTRAWQRAEQEHEEVLQHFLQVTAAVPPSRWHTARASGKWTATAVRHAVFGPLTPYQALRMLSAHTRHHTEGMRLRSGD